MCEIFWERDSKSWLSFETLVNSSRMQKGQIKGYEDAVEGFMPTHLEYNQELHSSHSVMWPNSRLF